MDCALAAAGLGLASVPHCMGMCGPIAGVASGTRKGALAYHLARLSAYATVGALLASMVAPLRDQLGRGPVAWLAAAVTATALLASAYRLSKGRSPSLIPASSLLRKDRTMGPLGSLGLGALTGLLPCGSLLGALGVASLAGSTSEAALAMLAFGTTSMVGLATSQLAFRALAAEGGGRARGIVAAVLVIAAVVTLGRPLLVGDDGASCHEPTSLALDIGGSAH